MVVDNNIFGNTQGIYFSSAGSTDIWVHRNISHANSDYGIYFTHPDAPAMISNNVSNGNSIGGVAIGISGSTFPDGTTLRNNIVSNNASFGLNVGVNSSNTISDFNYFWNNFIFFIFKYSW